MEFFPQTFPNFSLVPEQQETCYDACLVISENKTLELKVGSLDKFKLTNSFYLEILTFADAQFCYLKAIILRGYFMSRFNTFKTFCIFSFSIFDAWYQNSVPKELQSKVSTLNTEEFIFKIFRNVKFSKSKDLTYLQLNQAYRKIAKFDITSLNRI